MSRSTIAYRGYGGVRQGSSSTNLDAIARRGYAAYTGLQQPVAAGYQYETYSTTWAGNGLWLGVGASPSPVLGDVFITQTICTPGNYVVQINSDGTVEVFVGGDNSRQSFLYELYRVSGNAVDGPSTIWINEKAPVWYLPLVLTNIVPGVAMTPVNLASPFYVASPSGDILTFSIASGSLPGGVNLSSSGLVSGTPTATGTFTFTINATDYANVTTPSPTSQITVSTQGLTHPPAIVTWENNGLKLVAWFSGSYVLYNGMAPGTFGKYVGLTITSTGSIYQLNALDMDYKLRARWN